MDPSAPFNFGPLFLFHFRALSGCERRFKPIDVLHFVPCLLAAAYYRPGGAPEIGLRVGPNPFQGETLIRYSGFPPGSGRLDVYDVAGRLVRSLEMDESTVRKAMVMR